MPEDTAESADTQAPTIAFLFMHTADDYYVREDFARKIAEAESTGWQVEARIATTRGVLYELRRESGGTDTTQYEDALIQFYATLADKNLAGARRRTEKTAAELGVTTAEAAEHLIKRYIEFRYSVNKISGGGE